MNDNLAHVAYQTHIKQGRNVVILSETFQLGREHIRIAAQHYRYEKVDTKKHMILFERGPYLKAFCTSSRAHDLLMGQRNLFILVDDDALRRLPQHHYNEFVSMMNHINERTMSNG